ncbi:MULTISPECIES: alpha-L-rhamnosidase C-terminal domain-containing protein [Clostridia]|uniref:alpha-L-rhamnosidase-related protein n=1 Tax=Clostridia TaxID=186801 RepID=UPI000E482E18|nr:MULTISPECIES: alpha-L-rhamnosidase C-terminal domain-containing protein [Clostridia]MBT9836798.1 family 78 glycoside hydrolase catalytic domain [Blautia sp. MCC270]RHR70626.1 hypothetical protein DWW77_04510 [Ruminococcus sp. AF17-12]
MAETKTNWIWMRNWTAEDKEEAALVLFRKEIDIQRMPQKGIIQVSADSRYKLYVNGQLAEIGPCKGDRQIWFADKVNLMPYLKKGKNVLAVRVLRYPTVQNKGCFGIYRTEFPGFFAEGKILDDEGKEYSLDARDGWKVRKDENFHIVSESELFAPLQILENTRGALWQAGWMNPGYDTEGWEAPYRYSDMNQAVSPGNLQKRPIPFLFRKESRFGDVVQTQDKIISKEEWQKFLNGEQSILIPPNAKVSVEISAGVERTAYLHLALEQGAKAQISILQSEGYVLGGERGDLKVPVKGNREDYKAGFLAGFTDHYICAGFGTKESPEVYEPFWFRTFRFIRFEMKTYEEPLVLRNFTYTETGYSLNVQTKADASDERFKKIWEISERTLRCCMHETYEDCPFYEQLQYAMDIRAQILYTYAISADDRLARKCMEDFRRSQRYDGLLNCAAPRYDASVIPGFSIYYILMLYDHMMYFGDKELLENHMPTVEGILQFFHRNRNSKGYVEKIGGLNGKARFWSFIDWAVEWENTTGIPPAVLKGPVTMESLLYILGLQKAAKIAEYLDRKEQSALLMQRAEQVQEAVRTFCTGKDGMLQDGPGIEEYSQHTQVFAVLTDTVAGEQAKENLRKTILYKEKYSQCSVAMVYYLFRALEKTGMYELTESYWNIWQRMIDKYTTTCVEDEVQERSECHAWGALILYELPSVILGIRPSAPGYEKMEVKPVPGYLKSARGQVITPKGMVNVEWYRENKEIHIKLETSEGKVEKEMEVQE